MSWNMEKSVIPAKELWVFLAKMSWFFAVISQGFYAFNWCKNWLPIFLFWNSKKCIFVLLKMSKMCVWMVVQLPQRLKLTYFWFYFFIPRLPLSFLGTAYLQSIYFLKILLILAFLDKQCIIVSPLKLQFLPRFRALTAIYVYSSVLLLLLLYVVLVVVVLVCSVHLITNSIFGPFLILDNPTLLWPGNPKWPPHCNTHINTMVFKP